MSQDRRIDYVELPAVDLPAAKAFYTAAFGWTYQDWGGAYADTHDSGIASGVAAGDELRAPLVVMYADDLEGTHARVRAAGGTITREIFAFPGGRRFHFRDPAGNELGVWTKAAGDHT